MRIGIFDLEKDEQIIIEKLLKKYGLKADLFSKNYEGEAYDIVAVFVDSKIKNPNSKYIVTMSTGYDHIDLNACKSKKVAVYNVPDYGTNTVAEFTILLMLASLRKFPQILEEVETEISINPRKLRGYDLAGKTVGIIGTGRIGSRVAELCLSLGCKVLAYSRHKKQALLDKGVKYVSLHKLLEISNIISIHAALTSETFHLISEKNISLLKKGALIVNTSRGELIETEALLSRVDDLYFALDVVESENLLKKEVDVCLKEYSQQDLKKRLELDVLLKHPHAIITPHNAYNTHDAIYRILEKTVKTLAIINAGNEPDNRVI